MSINKLVDFNFKEDLVDCSNAYPCTDYQYIYIPDNNQGVYNNGYINFNQLSVTGSDTNKLLDWSQAYIAIPWTVTVRALASGTKTLSGTDTSVNAVFGSKNVGTANIVTGVGNCCAIAPKSNVHIIDNISLTYSNVTINRNTPYHNFMMNEKLKLMNEDEYRLYGDILNYRKDSANSYAIDEDVLEINNSLSSIKGLGFKNGLNYDFNSNFGNDGHKERVMKNNTDLSTNASSTDNKINNATNLNQVFGTSTSTNVLQTGCVFSSPFFIQYQYMSIIPFKYLFSFFENIPAVATTQNFSLKLQTNIANNNFWQVLYGYVVSNNNDTFNSLNYGVAGCGVFANQSIGHTCPVMLSKAETAVKNDRDFDKENVNGSGFMLNGYNNLNDVGAPTAGVAGLEVRTYIGWYNRSSNSLTNQNITLSGLTTNTPCRIYIPQIVMTRTYMDQILNQPKFKLLYEDFYVDTSIQAKAGGTMVQSLISANLSRPRKLYILPFFNPDTTFPYKTSTGNANVDSARNHSVVPYQSLLSSAPNTVSLCKLRQVQVTVGTNSIFMNPLEYNSEFYLNHALILNSKTNGNSLKSSMFSGQITQSDWEKCYGVYVFDLEKVADEIQDNIAKSFTVKFTIDALTNIKYDFIVMISYETEVYLDRATGEITKG